MEEEALRDFIAFLNNFGSKILLVGFDEDTMAVLRKKIKKFDKGESLYLYTWWKRILKYKRFIFNNAVCKELLLKLKIRKNLI